MNVIILFTRMTENPHVSITDNFELSTVMLSSKVHHVIKMDPGHVDCSYIALCYVGKIHTS